MPVNRKLITSYFTKDGVPAWRCPRCLAGAFELVPHSLHFAKTSGSALAEDEVWYDYDHVEYRFSALLKCGNARCLEVASLGGRGDVMMWQDERTGDQEYQDQFLPSYFSPSPKLITIPESCPAEVSVELDSAFVASWGDFSSAGNHVRTAVELLLNALKVRKTKKTKQGKMHALSLHDRLELLHATHPAVQAKLLAIKWIGNAGSHKALTREAVFDALDIFEMVLDSLYSDHPKAIDRLVARVNKRKGPP